MGKKKKTKNLIRKKKNDSIIKKNCWACKTKIKLDIYHKHCDCCKRFECEKCFDKNKNGIVIGWYFTKESSQICDKCLLRRNARYLKIRKSVLGKKWKGMKKIKKELRNDIKKEKEIN